MGGSASDATDRDGSWYWLLVDAAGVVMDGRFLVFTTQDAAESWLQDSWGELCEQGVGAVTLMDGERNVYGPTARPVGPIVPGSTPG